MAFSLLSWLLAGVLTVTCLAVARSAWNLGGSGPGISRMALLSSVLEAAAIAGFFRLVVQWNTGTTLLWVVAAAALAAAVAGTVIRWPELPSHAGLLVVTEPDPEPRVEPGTEATLRTKPKTKPRTKPRKKPKKKEPGRTAVVVRAGVLAAVVVVSVAVG